MNNHLSKKEKRIVIFTLSVLAIFIQVLIIRTPNNGVLVTPDVFEGTSFSIRGVMQSLMLLVCVMMVCVDTKAGKILARIFLGISTASLVTTIFRFRTLEALPGAISIVLGIVTCEIIAGALSFIEMESITDLVTKLYNRRGLMKELSKKNAESKHFHIMFLHIKNLKTVNDNLGYGYGDEALRILAERIQKVAGPDSIVSKLDGTEFAVAFPNEMDISEVPQRILEEVSKSVSFNTDGVTADFYFNVYAGVANYPEDADTIEKLMKYADIAMYHASHSTIKNLVYFNKDLENEINRRVEVEKYIQESLQNDYFYLVYQPQYKALTKELRGFETLLRMKLPNGTNVSPGEFIPIAEKTNLICRIDEYVIRRAMREFAAVFNKDTNDMVLSINVSAKDISNPNFPERVMEVAREEKFPAEKLEIEITEYSLYDSLDQTVKNIKWLRDEGVKFALDDFGTGYTSLSQLLNLPFDLLKIDKSLVDNIETSEVSRDFINLVIYMGHLMDSDVISEGVESENQLELLKDLECDFIQGYVWNRPLSYEDAKALC